jgi:tetratricopeptide (TPR) repeat protein
MIFADTGNVVTRIQAFDSGLPERASLLTYLKPARCSVCDPKGGFFVLRRHSVKNTIDNSIRVILIIAFYVLFSCATIHQTQAESRDAEACNNRGNVHADKGQYDKAISEYTTALKIKPTYAEVYYNRGYTYTIKGKCDDAIRDFNKALELNPKYAKAYHIRGIAYASKGRYDQAITDYTKALEINPQDAIAYCNRGVAHYFRKEYGKSWENVKKAQSLGYQIDPRFLDGLRKASGRQN